MTQSNAKILAGLIVAVSLFGACKTASAQQPNIGTGTLRHPNDAAWGTWEAFEGGQNGYWFRFTWNGGSNVATVVPFQFTSDGRLEFWWISYTLVGATDPNRTEGWQWVQQQSGRFILDKKNPGETFTNAHMITLTNGTQNYQPIPVSNPRWVDLRVAP